MNWPHSGPEAQGLRLAAHCRALQRALQGLGCDGQQGLAAAHSEARLERPLGECLGSILERNDHAHVAIFCCHQPQEMHLRNVSNVANQTGQGPCSCQGRTHSAHSAASSGTSAQLDPPASCDACQAGQALQTNSAGAFMSSSFCCQHAKLNLNQITLCIIARVACIFAQACSVRGTQSVTVCLSEEACHAASPFYVLVWDVVAPSSPFF